MSLPTIASSGEPAATKPSLAAAGRSRRTASKTKTTAPLHLRLLGDEAFLSGEYDAGYFEGYLTRKVSLVALAGRARKRSEPLRPRNALQVSGSPGARW